MVIGMGRFGKHLALKMQDLGNMVLAIDKEERIMQELMPHLENILIADCTSESFIQTLGVRNFDICYVATGGTFEATILITSYLKRYGAKYVVAKAALDIHISVLKSIGADEVVYPEWTMAEKTAVRHSILGIIDYLPLSDEYSIYEIEVPPDWIGKDIGHLHIRQNYQLNILTVKGADIHNAPGVDYVFEPGDQVVLLGKEEDVLRVCKV